MSLNDVGLETAEAMLVSERCVCSNDVGFTAGGGIGHFSAACLLPSPSLYPNKSAASRATVSPLDKAHVLAILLAPRPQLGCFVL